MKGRPVRVVDTTLRDGMHTVRHQFPPEAMGRIVAALDEAGVDVIEVSHGDGLGGSSINYGRAAAGDEAYLAAVQPVVRRAALAVLLVPGIGTKEHLEMAVRYGAKVARIATHCTEADIAIQHMGLAKALGMEVMGFLMLAHMCDLPTLVKNAKIMEEAGADVVYVVDSAGYLLPAEVKERVGALREALRCGVGFHAHNNLGCAIGNSLAALEAGAEIVDGSLRQLGAGGGNAATEVLVAALKRSGYQVNADLYKVMDAARLVDPWVPKEGQDPNAVLTLGYTGVYSSFYLHALRVAKEFGLDARELLEELGRRKVVGGQEDWIVEVAYQMAQARQAAAVAR